MRPLTQTINLSTLAHNAKELTLLAPSAKSLAVIKADAYGCGVEAVAALRHVDYFGVACIEEAVAIRNSSDKVSSKKAVVLLEGWFEESEVEISVEQNITPVITNSFQLQWLLNSKIDLEEVWIKVDTGMNRLGFTDSEVDSVITKTQSRYSNEKIVLMSHFSSAEESETITRKQLERFTRTTSPFPAIRKCLANSAGLIGYPEAHKDIVRFGIALYGINLLKKPEPNLKPVVTLTTKVIGIKQVMEGEHIGYGHSVTLKKPSHIAVIAIGYADGYPREYKKPPPVLIKGKIYRVIGRISMDMMTIKVDESVNIGDSVELWGNALSIESVAKDIGTIPYTLLINMASRVYRNYTY